MVYNNYLRKMGVIMRKYLNIILVLQIIGSVVEFFILLSQSFVLSILLTPLSILGIIPTIAIICNIDAIEELRYDLNKIRYDIKNPDLSSDNDVPKENTVPSAQHKETAIGTWECVKCGTVNKEGTRACSNCKEEYSSFLNPTASPYETKKVSRWIKEKK